MAEQNAPANSQEITIADVLQMLGLKEFELQYERARSAQASKVIAELRAELAKHEKGQ